MAPGTLAAAAAAPRPLAGAPAPEEAPAALPGGGADSAAARCPTGAPRRGGGGVPRRAARPPARGAGRAAARACAAGAVLVALACLQPRPAALVTGLGAPASHRVPATRAGARRALAARRPRPAPGARTRSARRAAIKGVPVEPAFVTIDKKMTALDARVSAMEKPEDELYWRLLAYCTACRTPWCKLPWRRHTCLKGDAKAEGTKGSRCDMPWEGYTDILAKSVPLISRQKAQVLTRECWKQGDGDPSGIGTVTVVIVPRPAAEEYCQQLATNGVQCSVVPDSFFEGGPSSKL